MLTALIKNLFGPARLVEIDEPDASGDAGPALRKLIRVIHDLEPLDIRLESGESLLDAVILQERLGEFLVPVEGVFGPPAKPFEVKCRFPDPLDAMIDSIDGIDKNQCLYLRRFEDGRVLYAALWPWGDPSKITLKLGCFAQPLPASKD